MECIGVTSSLFVSKDTLARGICSRIVRVVLWIGGGSFSIRLAQSGMTCKTSNGKCNDEIQGSFPFDKLRVRMTA